MRAEAIARALGGRRVGSIWMACCPSHNDRHPSLAIRDGHDGKVLVHCHAGCGQAQIIEALRVRGLWPACPQRLATVRRFTPLAPIIGRAHHPNANRREAALRIWREAEPAEGTQVESYLRSRGIAIAIPPALRFHPALSHPSGGRWPAMVALVTRGTDLKPVAIHRTFLAASGKRKAPIELQKLMLGPCGGAAVCLGPAVELLMIGEGIETCLAAMQATGQPAWAALSTSGLRMLNLPAGLRELIVLADGDEAGEVAARDAALRWKRQGRRARIARPPRGLDFNDLLLGREPEYEGGAA